MEATREITPNSWNPLEWDRTDLLNAAKKTAKVTAIAVTALAAGALAFTCPALYGIGAGLALVITPLALNLFLPSSDAPTKLLITAAVISVVVGIVLTGGALASIVWAIPATFAAIEALSVGSLVWSLTVLTTAGCILPTTVKLISVVEELLSRREMIREIANTYNIHDKAIQKQLLFFSLAFFPTLLEHEATRGLLVNLAPDILLAAMALNPNLDLSAQFLQKLTTLNMINNDVQDPDTLLQMAGGDLWPQLITTAATLTPEQLQSHSQAIIQTFCKWRQTVENLAQAAPTAEGERAIPLRSPEQVNTVVQQVLTSLKGVLPLEQEEADAAELVKNDNNFSAEVEALIAIGEKLAADQNSDITAANEKLSTLQRALFVAHSKSVTLSHLELLQSDFKTRYQTLLEQLEKNPSITNINNLNAAARAKEQNSEQDLQEDALDFLLMGSSQLQDRTLWIKQEDFLQWTGTTTYDEAVEKFGSDLGLKTVQDVLDKEILTQEELSHPELFRERIQRYVDSRQPDSSAVSQLYRMAASDSSASEQPRGRFAATLVKIDAVVAPIFYRALLVFSQLAPVLAYPAPGAFGFGIGAAYTSINRISGGRLSRSLEELNRYNILNTVISLLRYDRQRLFTLDAISRQLAQDFVNAGALRRLQLVSLEMISMLFRTNFLFETGGFLQGFCIGREAVNSGCDLTQRLWRRVA